MYKFFFKRIFDFCIALVALICFSPLLLVIIILIHIGNKGAGIFFFQERPGKNAKIFRIIKFKTMTDERDSVGNLLQDAYRFTKLGKYLRSFSLDELPQLLNVLKGNMSLIGPRPLASQYLPLYSKEQARRHEIRPGITGWAQVNGRNLLSFRKRFIYDVWYVDHLTFLLDLKICIMTLLNVIQRKNIGSGSDDMQIIDDVNFDERIQQNNKQKNA